jgi:hypothetical protein
VVGYVTLDAMVFGLYDRKWGNVIDTIARWRDHISQTPSLAMLGRFSPSTFYGNFGKQGAREYLKIKPLQSMTFGTASNIALRKMLS